MAPNAPGSPLRKSFFGASFFTSPPEDDGDLPAETMHRKSWWGGDSSPPHRAPRKSEKEKYRSYKGKSGEETATENKETSEGQSHGVYGKVEGKTRVESRSLWFKEVREGAAEYHALGRVEKDMTKAEVMSEVGVVGNGSLPVGEDKTGELSMVDEELKAEAAKETGTGEYTTRALRKAKSLHSLSRGSTKLKKRWTLMIGKKSAPEVHMPIPGKRLTEDVAGSRFETAKKQQEERCAGDYPPIYRDGFVSPIPPPHLYPS
jgi:hypothetical protein